MDENWKKCEVGESDEENERRIEEKREHKICV